MDGAHVPRTRCRSLIIAILFFAFDGLDLCQPSADGEADLLLSRRSERHRGGFAAPFGRGTLRIRLNSYLRRTDGALHHRLASPYFDHHRIELVRVVRQSAVSDVIAEPR